MTFGPYEKLSSYINLSFFSNKLIRGLSDFQRTGDKSDNIGSSFKILSQMFDKYNNWSPTSKYDSIVDTLLDSEEEHQFLTQVLKDFSGKENANRNDIGSVIDRILGKGAKINVAIKVTQPTKEDIDYVVDFLMVLSNYSVMAQEYGGYGVGKGGVSVTLK